MDNEKLISKIFFEIQKDPSDYRAYEDVFSLCRSIEESDFKLAHDTNTELRSYISRGMKTSAYAKLFDLYRRSLLVYKRATIREFMGNCDFSLPALPTNNKTPGRACYSTRCFVVCPNSVPIKNRVFGLYFNGGGEESRTPVRKPVRTAFYECSCSFNIPSASRRTAG